MGGGSDPKLYVHVLLLSFAMDLGLKYSWGHGHMMHLLLKVCPHAPSPAPTLCGQLVVAGDDYHADACGMAVLNRGAHLDAGRATQQAGGSARAVLQCRVPSCHLFHVQHKQHQECIGRRP